MRPIDLALVYLARPSLKNITVGTSAPVGAAAFSRAYVPWHSPSLGAVDAGMNATMPNPRPGAASATAARYLPEPPGDLSLSELRERALHCRACPLYKLGTQTVFGEGPRKARIVLVGEQPGDQEDRQGQPFVGPAGLLLDRALAEANVNRADVYVTNAVKHFKWEPSGKRRLHKKPNSREIAACRPWLEYELAALEPDVLVALGATAAQALMGRDFLVSRERGRVIEHVPWARVFLATVHPSSILRGPSEERERSLAAFIADLKIIPETLARLGAA